MQELTTQRSHLALLPTSYGTLGTCLNLSKSTFHGSNLEMVTVCLCLLGVNTYLERVCGVPGTILDGTVVKKMGQNP